MEKTREEKAGHLCSMSFRLRDSSRLQCRQRGSSGQCRFHISDSKAVAASKNFFSHNFQRNFLRQASLRMWSPGWNTLNHCSIFYFDFFRSTTHILGVLLFYFLGSFELRSSVASSRRASIT